MKQRILSSFLMLLLFVATGKAQRYWVAVTAGVWSNAANWSLTSGGAGGAGAPVGTNAIFNGASGATGNCTIDVPVTITNLFVLAGYSGTILQGSNLITITGASTWSGGTFTGGTANIINAGAMTLSGTSFLSTAGTLSLANTFNFSSGTFSHNNGTTCFHSNSFAVSGAPTFFNLRFNSGSNAFTINNSFLAAGNVTLDATSGTSLDMNLGAAVTITVGGALAINGTGLIRCNTGTICALGDIVNSNTSLSGGGTATLRIAGTGNQTFSSSSAIKRGRFPSITIDKNSGTLSLSGIITTIGPNWTYSSGAIAPGTSTVYFQRQPGGSNIVISGNHTLYDAVFYPEYSTTTVSNSLTLNNLTLDGSQDQDVDISGNIVVNGTLSVTGTERLFINLGTIYVAGDIAISNTNSNGGGTGTIVINGSGDQLFSNSGALAQGRVPSVIINKPSGNLTLSGNITTVGPTWTYSGGTIIPGSSTLYLYRNGTNITVSGSHNINNLHIHHPSYATTIINNDLSVNSMTIDGSTQHNLTINSSISVNGNLTITGTDPVVLNTGTINAKGNITNLNTHTGSGGTAVFIINGTSNQNLTGTGLANQSKLPPIILNKPSGQLIITGNPYFLYNSINFMQGVIVTSGSSLLIFGAGSSVAGSPGVLSHVQGPVRKIGNTAFTFPVGKNGEYAPIGISAPAGATSAFTAEYFDANPNPTYNVSLRDGTLDHISTCEYWDLQRTTGASNVSVTLSWDIRSCGVTNLADLRVAHWDPNLGTPIWKDMGIGTITGNTTAGTIRSNMLVSSFSPFTLASSSSFNPLPIQLVSFKTRCDKSRTLIEWITASEKNNSYFTVEKSKNGLSWKSVADINSKTNPEGANLYTYSDAAASYGDLTYYRLRQTDFNNEYSYSNVEVVKNCSPDPTERVYPNPTPGALTLESNYFGQEISIHTMNGDLIYSGRIENSKTTIDLSDHPAGLYILRTEGSNYRNIIQVLK